MDIQLNYLVCLFDGENSIRYYLIDRIGERFKNFVEFINRLYSLKMQKHCLLFSHLYLFLFRFFIQINNDFFDKHPDNVSIGMFHSYSCRLILLSQPHIHCSN